MLFRSWQTMGGIFTTGLKVAAGAYIAHEVVDFASTAVTNAGHNTVASGDGSFIGDENTLVGGDHASGDMNKPSDSYNIKKEIPEEEPEVGETPEPDQPDPVADPPPNGEIPVN